MDDKDALPPSYYDVTGVKPEDKKSTSKNNDHSVSVNLDLDDIQVTYQFTNPTSEQSSEVSAYDAERRQYRLPGMENDTARDQHSRRRRRTNQNTANSSSSTDGACAAFSKKFLSSGIVVLMVIIVVIVLFGNVYKFFD